MKKRILSLFLSLIIILDVFAILPPLRLGAEDSEPTQEQEPNEDYIEGFVTLTYDGEDHVAMQKGDKLYAFTEIDDSLDRQYARYAWEIQSGEDRWATVSGYVFRYAIITDALLSNAAIIDGAAHLRCIVTIGEDKYVSNVLKVSLSETKTEASAMASGQVLPLSADASEESDLFSADEPTMDAFHIVINYTYRHAEAAPGLDLNGKNAANVFTVTLPDYTSYTGTVATPPEIGYLPYVTIDQAEYVLGTPSKADYITYDGVDYVLANSIEFVEQSEDVTINVYFIPQQVTFRVKIYEQNLYDDEYTLVQTITKTGVANAAVGENHDTPRTGFSPLYYDEKLSIDEDGSFILDIYYDRNYYLLDLDLNDKGDAFGVVNHYVRYQTTVVLPPPTRPAHSFLNWELISVKSDLKSAEEVTEHSYPATAESGYIIHSLEHNLVYRAHWSEGKTSYTIIYWLENAENDGFTLDSFDVVSDVNPGTKVSATDSLDIPDKSCFTFSDKLSDKEVTVSSDGTTAINAYYLRNYYTYTFKGAAACITKEHTHSDACLMGNCTIENHAHTAACGNADLICGKTEHVHVDECCTITEHAHDSTCCSIAYHVHGTGANSDCTKPVHERHHDTCYSKNVLTDADVLTNNNQKKAYSTLKSKITGPLNGYVYRIRLSRNSTIYNFLYVHEHWFYLGTNSTYNNVNPATGSSFANPASAANSYSSAAAKTICGYEIHTHGDGNCTCPITEHDHTSGCTCSITRHVHGEGDCDNSKCGQEQHRHNTNCYTHNCGKTAHTHGGNCVRTCQQQAHTHSSRCSSPSDSQNIFLEFKAKYQADISAIWRRVWEIFPNGERWDPSTYFSEVLVYVPFMTPASITFTSNTSSNATYTINYYLEALGTTEIEYKEKYFDLNNTVKANYSYLTTKEDFFDILGFTQFESDPAASGGQIKDNDLNVSLYYERNEYPLEFVSLGTTLSPYTKVLKYQQPIGASFELMPEDIPYPSSKESGAIRFVGWYSSPNCADGTEFTFDGSTTMPVGGLVLYAKWETCSYTVSVYSNVEKEMLLDCVTVPFDSFIVEPDYTHVQHPGGLPEHEHPGYNDDDHMIFVGWFYKEDGKEKRFDFNTMSVKFDMEIYAKWTSRKPVKYTVRYVYHNGTDYVDIADQTTGLSLAGVTKHFSAKVTTDLYDKYRVFYFPDIRSHSITMSSDESENVYLFVYSSVETISYTVTHNFVDLQKVKSNIARLSTSEGLTTFETLFGEGNDSLTLTLPFTISGESIRTQAAMTEVSFRKGVLEDVIAKAAEEQYEITLEDDQKTLLADTVANMSPDFFIQNLILTTNPEDNHVTFNWDNKDTEVLYQIIYYEESVDGKEYTIHSTRQGKVAAGTWINAETSDLLKPEKDVQYFDHFDFNRDLSVTSGEAVKLEMDSNGEFGKGLVLKIYYTRKEYGFTVHYYKEGTMSPVSVSRTDLKAKYQATVYVADVAKEIAGYTLVNINDKPLTISSDETQQIICRYTGLEVYYQYQIMGTGMGATIENPTDTITIGSGDQSTKKLTLWSEGYFINKWYYSIDDGELLPVPEDKWLSNNKTVITVEPPEADMAGKTVYIFAEVLPTTRRFRVDGFATDDNDPQAFVFRLQGKAGTQTAGIDVTFTIFDTGYLDIERLPFGQYTLTTLHWAWRLGHPDTVTFNDQAPSAETGTVTLDLNTTGDVIITYSDKYSEKWLSDDASGYVPISPKAD